MDFDLGRMPVPWAVALSIVRQNDAKRAGGGRIIARNQSGLVYGFATD
jgi:hypothetical protein